SRPPLPPAIVLSFMIPPAPRSTLFPYTTLFRSNRVLEVLAAIKEATEIPVLFTIRAQHEGGERITLKTEDKVDLLEKVCGQSDRSEEHTSELQSRFDLVCRLLLEKKKHKSERTS